MPNETNISPNIPSTANAPAPVLDIQRLTKVFGGLRAVGNFDLTVQQGALDGLIGPNGAGKTTVFNMITGLYIPTEGEINFNGESLIGLEPFEITQTGIGRTFQNIRLFPNLSVLDNVLIAYHPHAGYGLFDGLVRTARFGAKEHAAAFVFHDQDRAEHENDGALRTPDRGILRQAIIPDLALN